MRPYESYQILYIKIWFEQSIANHKTLSLKSFRLYHCMDELTLQDQDVSYIPS